MIDTKQSETLWLAGQFEQIHDGGAWHGPSVAEAIDGVSAAGAAARPIGAAHSIAELVHHLRVTEEAVHRRLTGEAATGEPDWPERGAIDETAWRAAVAGLRATQRALRQAVAELPPALLDEPVGGASHSHRDELAGLLRHDAYHAGQIALLKKTL